MSEVPNSFVRVEDNGVLYLSVGYIETEEGPGYFDAALLFCPFCGTRLQNYRADRGGDALARKLTRPPFDRDRRSRRASGVRSPFRFQRSPSAR